MNSVHDVIGTIYDAALEPAHWPAALDRIIDITGSKSGNLISSDRNNRRSDVAVFSGIDPDWIRRYNDHYYQFDPSMHVFARHGGRAIADQVTRNGFRGEFRNARTFYHELMLPQQFHHTAGAGLFFTETHNAGIILQRSGQQGEYETKTLEVLDQLTPHIRRSLELNRHHSRLGFQKGLEAAFENSNRGVMLIDETGRVLFLNTKAENFVQSFAEIDLRDNRLALSDAATDSRLQAMLAAAIRAANGKDRYTGSSLTLELPETGSILGIQVAPVRTRLESDVLNPVSGHALVELTASPEPTTVPADGLAAYFGLTSTEARVLSDICQGKTPEAIAESRVRSIHTIRSQTKAIMKKLGVTRKSDLVRRVLTSPVAVPKTGWP